MIDIIIPTLGVDPRILETIRSLDNWKPLIGKIIIVSKSSEIHELLGVRDISHNVEIIIGGESVYSAMNLGLQSAISEYIYFIGDGDNVYPLNISLKKALIDGCDILFARVRYIDESNTAAKTLPRFSKFHSPLFVSLLVNSGWPHQGVIISRKLHQEFDDRYSIIADQVHLFKISQNIRKEIFSSEVISDFNSGGISSNKEKRKMEWTSFYKELMQCSGLSFMKIILIKIRLFLL